MNLKRRFSVLAAILLLSVSCSRARRPSDVLVVGVSASLNLGPNHPVVMHRNSNVWETLTELDAHLVPKPSLARSWESSADGKTWTFHLRPGVAFHNGDRWNAAAAAANIWRLKRRPDLDYYSTFTHLEHVHIVDELTVQLNFSQPMADLPAKLGHYFAGIFSPAAFAEDGRLKSPIGSGPYVFVESKIGQYDRVRAFGGYHGGRPFFREIEFRIIPDPVVRVMSLLRGDIDLIAHHGGIPPNYVQLLGNQPDVQLESKDLAITHYLLFNCARPPFRELLCRGAVSDLLDRRQITGRILQGAGLPARDFLAEAAARWQRGRFSVEPSRDPAVLQRLARCRTDRPAVLLLNQGDASNWGYRPIADFLASSLAASGFPLRIETLEGGAWQQAAQEGRYDITLYPLSMPTGAPELLVRRLAYSQGMRVRAIGNTTHYSSKRLDQMFEAAVNAPTLEAKERSFHAILDFLAREKPFVPLYHERYYFAYRRGLLSVQVDPFTKVNFAPLRWAAPWP